MNHRQARKIRKATLPAFEITGILPFDMDWKALSWLFRHNLGQIDTAINICRRKSKREARRIEHIIGVIRDAGIDCNWTPGGLVVDLETTRRALGIGCAKEASRARERLKLLSCVGTFGDASYAHLKVMPVIRGDESPVQVYGQD